jgi:hypothetical protein
LIDDALENELHLVDFVASARVSTTNLPPGRAPRAAALLTRVFFSLGRPGLCAHQLPLSCSLIGISHLGAQPLNLAYRIAQGCVHISRQFSPSQAEAQAVDDVVWL